jgi:mRNA interferase RelE/StbE
VNTLHSITKKPEYSKQAAKAIKSMARPSKQRIKKGIEKIPKGDIKPLKGTKDVNRLRVGDWRILFSYLDGGVYVRKIEPRGDVYKEV